MVASDILIEKLKSYNGRQIKIMEVCGTHTTENFRLGIRSLLPQNIKLVSGPGCPVCVTPTSFIDEAIWLGEKGATLCSFGDLLRVPGSNMSLADLRSRGAEVKVVYSPLDAVNFAQRNSGKQVVFLSVGFETTVPGTCLAVKKAVQSGLNNFSVLTANRTMPNAYRTLGNCADAFLYPGHVSAITGMELYEDLAREGISGVVAGFTAVEILSALNMIVKRLQEGKPFAENCYTRVVAHEGNPIACKLIAETMRECDTEWRGLGIIPHSGLQLRAEYEAFDARKKFQVPVFKEKQNLGCRCGEVLKGECEPPQCKHFGKTCTPEMPVGACMVSTEGTCAAFYKYANN
jgi:hydrogenase expression/formation protein HypD